MVGQRGKGLAACCRLELQTLLGQEFRSEDVSREIAMTGGHIPFHRDVVSQETWEKKAALLSLPSRVVWPEVDTPTNM